MKTATIRVESIKLESNQTRERLLAKFEAFEGKMVPAKLSFDASQYQLSTVQGNIDLSQCIIRWGVSKGRDCLPLTV